MERGWGQRLMEVMIGMVGWREGGCLSRLFVLEAAAVCWMRYWAGGVCFYGSRMFCGILGVVESTFFIIIT